MSITTTDSKMSARHLPIILIMINSISRTSFSALMIQKYRHQLSLLNERKRGPTPSNHTRYYLIRHNRGNHQTTAVTNQRMLFRFSPYTPTISVLMNSSSPHKDLSKGRHTHTHTHTHTDSHFNLQETGNSPVYLQHQSQIPAEMT